MVPIWGTKNLSGAGVEWLTRVSPRRRNGFTGHEQSFFENFTAWRVRMLDAIDQAGESGGTDVLVRDTHRGYLAEPRGGLEAIEAGDGTILGHADSFRLQVLNKRVGHVIGGAYPGGDARFLGLASHFLHDLGWSEPRGIFVHVKHPCGIKI